MIKIYGVIKLPRPVYLTKERLLEIEKELNDLKKNGRKEVADRIAEARSHGDLSENAEYDAAKEEQGMLEMKIGKLEDLLSRAQVIDKGKNDDGKAQILSTVTVKNHKNNKTFTYTLVSPEEANLQKGKIAITSPVGQALMGKKEGEITNAEVPAGTIKFEILKVE